MPLLFRAYSDSSAGTNTPTLFAPQAASGFSPITSYTAPSAKTEELGKKLKTALSARKMQSPFVFYTASLMFAVQVARSRKSKGEKNVCITAVDVGTAPTPAGRPATFTHVPEMLKELGIRLERAGGEEKDYRDIFLCMDVLFPGDKSKTVKFEQLESAGLYQLYPALACGDERDDGRTRLNRNIEDLRAFHFRAPQMLMREKMALAAKVASMFSVPGQQTESLDLGILAHLLAFQKRSVCDTPLLEWLRKNTVETISLVDDGNEDDSPLDETIGAIEIEEVQQYKELNKLFANRELLSAVPTVEAGLQGVTQIEINTELSAFGSWKLQQRDEHRASREVRPDYDPNRPRRSEGRRSFDTGTRFARRADRPWLPREQYIAQRDARRAQRQVRGSGPGYDRSQRRLLQPSTTELGVLQPGGVSRHRRY